MQRIRSDWLSPRILWDLERPICARAEAMSIDISVHQCPSVVEDYSSDIRKTPTAYSPLRLGVFARDYSVAPPFSAIRHYSSFIRSPKNPLPSNVPDPNLPC